MGDKLSRFGLRRDFSNSIVARREEDCFRIMERTLEEEIEEQGKIVVGEIRREKRDGFVPNTMSLYVECGAK